MMPGSRFEIRKALAGFVYLLGSSVVSAVGLILIASNRWSVFDTAAAVFLILFIQWQTLGLTIAKTGVEQVVFAMVSRDEGVFLDPARYVLRRALPLAIPFSVIVCFVFSPWAGAVALGTILLDTWSLIIMADLNARKRFGLAAVSNLLNYPLFFLGILALGRFVEPTIPLTLALFLLASLVRCMFLAGNRFVSEGMREVSCTAGIGMGVQQGLNYLLFRLDQLVLALLGVRFLTEGDAGLYVFLAKFPELAAGVMGVAATVIFPSLYLRYPFRRREIPARLARHGLLITGYVAVMALVLLVYTRLRVGTDVSPWLLAPFLVHAVAIILVNNLTYSALRQGYLRRLLVNLALAVAAGLAMAAFLPFGFDLYLLAWIVPVQLLVFIALTFALDWGRAREIYG